MIFLSLHHGGPHANPAKRVVWGEGGTTEWSGCPPSGGRSGVEFVPTRRRRRRLKRTGATAPVLTGVWGRSATNKHAPGIYRRIACCCYQDRFLLLPTSFLCYSFYFRCFWSPVKRQITWSSMIMIGLLVLITLARRWPDLCRGYTTATAPLVS